MLLAVDVGNTHITLGVYDKDDLISNWRIATDRQKSADEIGILLFNLFNINNIDRIGNKYFNLLFFSIFYSPFSTSNLYRMPKYSAHRYKL